MAKLVRKCYRCKEEKDLNEFPNHKYKPLNKCYRCKKCAGEQNGSMYTKEHIKKRNRRALLKYKYNLTIAEWDRIYEEQGGGCLICTEEEDLVVDHNHGTGEVRGLLCRNCNTGLGMFKDNDLIIQAAARYLQCPS